MAPTLIACVVGVVLSCSVTVFGQSAGTVPPAFPLSTESPVATTNIVLAEPAPALQEPAAPAIIAPVAAVQTASPSPPSPSLPTSPSSGEIRRQPKAEPAAADTGATRSSNAVYETVKVVGSLGLVLAVIVGLKMAASKLLGIKSITAGANRGVRVLSRSILGPKQQLVLIQVGRKLVLVSDSAGTVSTVCEITDPDEVAELAAQASGGASAGAAWGGNATGQRGFGQMFAKRRDQFLVDDETRSTSAGSSYTSRRLLAEADAEDETSDLSEVSSVKPTTDVDELEDLARRVRSIGRQFSAR